MSLFAGLLLDDELPLLLPLEPPELPDDELPPDLLDELDEPLLLFDFLLVELDLLDELELLDELDELEP